MAGTNDTEAEQHLSHFAANHHGELMRCMEDYLCP